MRTLRRTAPLAALVVVIVLAAACAPVKSPGGGAGSLAWGDAHPQARELFYLVNSERAAHGLGPVGWNNQLGGLAQNWSSYMAGSGNFSHQNLDAILQDAAFAGFSGLGENIISGACGTSSAQLHNAWMGSSMHGANILGNFNAIGIGIACNGGTVYAAEDFGR
jgi:uncharacterized protein YkwD